jgi:predicted MFS family arabinose efflux permease
VLVARGITALAVSAFNVSIAAATWLAGVALDSSLGATGPSAVGRRRSHGHPRHQCLT